MGETEYEGDVDDSGEWESDDSSDAGEDEWVGPSREEWTQMQETLSGVAPVLGRLGELASVDPNQYGYGEEQQYDQPQWDPLDPEGSQQYIEAQIQAGLEAALGPFQGILGMVASREGESLAKAELERLSGEGGVGAFDHDAALLISSGMIEQGGDPTAALQGAAQYMHEFESKIRADEREKYKAELERIASGADQGASVIPMHGQAAVRTPDQPEGLSGEDRYRFAVERALHPQAATE